MDKIIFTCNFIYVAFAIIIIYDIIAVIIQHKKIGQKLGIVTITTVLRKWYKEKPIVSFMVGGLFIGHMGVYEWNNLLQKNASIIVFIILASIFGIWFIIEMIKEKLKKECSRLYKIFKFWPVSMTVGTLVMSFWR